jgi:LPS-assembly lipoprotein
MAAPHTPGRRGVLAMLAAVGLGGCGFQPLYGTSGEAGAVVDRLAEVNVLLIPERTGQLLRQSLMTRLERGGAGAARRYDLSVQLRMSADPIAIQPDNSTSRVRLIGSANWLLTAKDAQRRTLASGTVREVDGYNIINQQFFAAELTSNAVQRRMVDALAEQITTQLALHFGRPAEG